MSGGIWNNYLQPGDSPSHFNMWQKMQFGWVTPTYLDKTQTVSGIPAAENEPVTVRLSTLCTAPTDAPCLDMSAGIVVRKAEPTSAPPPHAVITPPVEKSKAYGLRPNAGMAEAGALTLRLR